MNKLNETVQQISKLQLHVSLKLSNKLKQTPQLSKKTLSSLSNKIYSIVNNSGNQKQKQQSNQIFIKVFQTHLKNFINNHIILDLVKSTNDQNFASVYKQKWTDFKYFTIIYHIILMQQHNYYQKKSTNIKSQSNKNEKELPTIAPVSVIAIRYFKIMVIDRFINRITRTILELLSIQRKGQCIYDSRLMIMMQSCWAISLSELARIRIRKQEQNKIQFYQQSNGPIIQKLKIFKDNQSVLRSIIFNQIQNHVKLYYQLKYKESLIYLSSHQFISAVLTIFQQEESIAQAIFPSKQSIKNYLHIVYNQLLISDIDNILNKAQGIRHLIMSITLDTQSKLKMASNYFLVFKRVQQKCGLKLAKTISQIINNKGIQLNAYLNKYKQYVTQAILFKKILSKIILQNQLKSISLRITVQKSFKKIFQSMEAAKNMAQFTDFIIKQCSRLKLDLERARDKFKDILFIFTSLTARDSYLYHLQQLLSRRLIDSLNQPKIQLQLLFLQMIGEEVGKIMIKNHLSMIKDIQKSIQTSQQLSQNLPFLPYKWTIRVFNPNYWPQSAVKHKYTHIQIPNQMKLHALQIQQFYQKMQGVTIYLRFDRGTSLFQGKFKESKIKFQAQNALMLLLIHLQNQPKNTIKFSQLRNKYFKDNKQDHKFSALHYLILTLVQFGIVFRNQKKQGFIEQQQQFSLNKDFRLPPGTKSNIPLIIRASPNLMKQLNQNNIEHGKILKQRQKLIDAALVKLLKHASSNNAKISFSDLYQGIQANKFLKQLEIPESTVKQRLQYLIINQYCRRDEEDRRLYQYIA